MSDDKQKKPVILDLNIPSDKEEHDRLSHLDYVKKIDVYDVLLKELCRVQNPHLNYRGENVNDIYDNFITEFLQGVSMERSGKWIYYSWANTLVHLLDPDLHALLRTARNRNLITSEEQGKFRQLNVGVVGLSVGQSSAFAIVRGGGADRIKLVDDDTIELTNLNRLNNGVLSLGEKKVDAAAKWIYELNPYAEVVAYDHLLDYDHLDHFINTPFKLDLIVDAMDDIRMKIAIRKAARKERIPVLMATDCGNGVLMDIERYDLNPELPLFNGILSEEFLEQLEQNYTPDLLMKSAIQMISAKNIPSRLQQSVMKLGRELAGIPQLGLASSMAGSVVAYIARKIANNEEFSSHRRYINLDKLFELNYNSDENKNARETELEAFMKLLHIDD